MIPNETMKSYVETVYNNIYKKIRTPQSDGGLLTATICIMETVNALTDEVRQLKEIVERTCKPSKKQAKRFAINNLL
jgi:hypothetical protein